MTAMLMGGGLSTTAVHHLSGFIDRFWRPWKHSEFFMLLVVTSLLAAACLLLWQYRRLAFGDATARSAGRRKSRLLLNLPPPEAVAGC